MSEPIVPPIESLGSRRTRGRIFALPNHDCEFEDYEMDYVDAVGMSGRIGDENDMDVETPRVREREVRITVPE